jgi:predicted nucleic acid-binding protein
MTGPFFDTNVLLYLIGSDPPKAALAEAMLGRGGTISVQVLNEFANVARRKQSMTWPEIGEALGSIRAICRVDPLTVDVHDAGLRLARTHGFALYDAMIVASAVLADCDVLYSEDLQHGRRVEGRLTIRNPFRD